MSSGLQRATEAARASRLARLAEFVPVIEAAGWSVRYADRIAELIVTAHPES